MAISSRTGIKLPPHTWHARGDDVTIYFPIQHWLGIFAKMRLPYEEKGYYFCEEDESGRSLSLFHIIDAESLTDRVHAAELVLDAIGEFTRHQNIHIIPYHTHPINGPSRGDLEAYIKIYDKSGGQYRDFLTIGPQRVELNRVYPEGYVPRVRDIAQLDRRGNPTTDWVKLIRLDPVRQAEHTMHGKALGEEFCSIIHRLYYD